MKDAIKTLYEHWINVHTTTPAEKSAFEVINEAAKGQAEHDPLYAAIVDYSSDKPYSFIYYCPPVLVMGAISSRL